MNVSDADVLSLVDRHRSLRAVVLYAHAARKRDEAIEILTEILRSDEVVGDSQGDIEKFPPEVSFTAFGPDFLNIRADYWYLMTPDADSTDIQRDTDRGYLTYLAHRGVVNRMVYKRFNDAGIDFAFPTRTLKLEQGDSPLTIEQNDAES